MNQYEAMFIFDPTFATKYSDVENEVNRIMERANAEDVVSRKWDDRRLAYRIEGRKRGVYVLVFFKAPGEGVASIERDAQLTEHVLRVMVLRSDHLTEDDVAQSRTAAAEASRIAAEEEARNAEQAAAASLPKSKVGKDAGDSDGKSSIATESDGGTDEVLAGSKDDSSNA